MKSRPYFTITATLLCLFGCARQVPLQWSPQEQAVAKTEIREVIDGMIRSLENMDIEAACQPFLDSPEFRLFTPDGTLASYHQGKNFHVRWFKSLSCLRVKTVRDELRLLPGRIAIFTWLARWEITPKNSQPYTRDFGVTFVLEQREGHWKIVYQHSSTFPSTQMDGERGG